MNKRLFKKQMMTIAITIIAMIAIFIMCKHLTTNGLGSLFTINAYAEAYSMQAFDIYVIKVISSVMEIFSVFVCYINLQSNAEEEKDLILLERGELEWN